MGKFNIVKNGYSESEVDSYLFKITAEFDAKSKEQQDRIFELKNDLDSVKKKLEKHSNSEKHISTALVAAAEKAKQIEDSSRRVYELEIKKIRLLYNKWNELLASVNDSLPDENKKAQIKDMVNEFKGAINSTLNSNLFSGESQQQTDPMRKLLDKVTNYLNNRSEEIKKTSEVVNNILLNDNKRKNNITPILYDNNSSSYQSDVDPVDRFLNSFDDDNQVELNAFQRKITNKELNSESGFDLQQAINPTEDLYEIMKAFDLDDDN